MSPTATLTKTIQGTRRGARAHCVHEITVSNEGHDELIHIKSPDLSLNGMFISTVQTFPEGTVLNLNFRLAVTGAEVRTRCEVRHSLPGVGIGVEFIDLPPEAAMSIELELARSGETSRRKGKSPARSRSPRRR